LIAKIAYEPSWGGHYELFGVSRFFRARLFPNATAAEIKAGTATTVGAFKDCEAGGGIGGSIRIPVLRKKVDLGLKGLWVRVQVATALPPSRTLPFVLTAITYLLRSFDCRDTRYATAEYLHKLRRRLRG
jgi:hypothetical protein